MKLLILTSNLFLLAFSSLLMANEKPIFPPLYSVSISSSHLSSTSTGLESIELPLKKDGLATWLFYDIYQAALYSDAPNKETLLTGQYSIHLELYYLRDLPKERLVKGANQVLERQHSEQQISRYKKEINRLHQAYRNIQEGDRYSLTYIAPKEHTSTGNNTDSNTGTHTETHTSSHQDNDAKLTLCYNRTQCENYGDQQFAQMYLGIWLAENSISDTLREELLSWNITE